MTLLKFFISFAFVSLQSICDAQSLRDSVEKKLGGKKWGVQLVSEVPYKELEERLIGDTLILFIAKRPLLPYKLKKNKKVKILDDWNWRTKKNWGAGCGNRSPRETYLSMVWRDWGTWKISENSDGKITLHLPRSVYELINPEKLLFVLIQDLTPKN